MPVQAGMPKNCSKDLSLVIDHIDAVLQHGSPSNKTALKTKFGLGGLEHDDDFGAALENGPWLWQSNSFTSNYSRFFRFCDYIENAGPFADNMTNSTGYGSGTVPDEDGVGLDKALDGYAAWMKRELILGG